MIDEPVIRCFQASILPSLQDRSDAVVIDGTIEVVPDVFLACPHHLYGTIDLLRHAHGLFDAVDIEPATEAATEQLVVHGHLRERQTGDLGGDGLGARADLRADPDIANRRVAHAPCS